MIGLLDCNNFFVSCERLFRPDLQHKAVVVLSGNDGCVVARSNEVKAAKIPMGAPYFQVKADLTALNTTLFSSNFTLYRDISARVMRVLKETVGEVEQYSVDEAFFRVSDGDLETVEAELRRIKAVIETQIGVPVSVGAATTKTIAKYASEKAKRTTGTCCLIGTDWTTERPTIAVEQIWGVGAQVAKRLRAHGIMTVADFTGSDRSVVARLFGLHGVRLYDELSEISIHRLGERAKTEQKSIMSTRSFKQTIHDQSAVEDALAYHVAHAMEELRAANLEVQYVTVVARPSRHSDWALRTGSAEVALPVPTTDTRTVLKAVKSSFASWYDPEVPYKKAGVILSRLRPQATHTQGQLFTDTATEQTDSALMDLVDTLNDTHGTGTLTLGRTRKQETWNRSIEYLSPHYTTQWSEIPVIKG